MCGSMSNFCICIFCFECLCIWCNIWRPLGLGVWFFFRVEEVPGSIPGADHHDYIFDLANYIDYVQIAPRAIFYILATMAPTSMDIGEIHIVWVDACACDRPRDVNNRHWFSSPQRRPTPHSFESACGRSKETDSRGIQRTKHGQTPKHRTKREKTAWHDETC